MDSIRLHPPAANASPKPEQLTIVTRPSRRGPASARLVSSLRSLPARLADGWDDPVSMRFTRERERDEHALRRNGGWYR